MKTIFLLKHLDIESIDSKYNFSFKSNIYINNTHKPNTTDLKDLNSNTNNDLFCYLDYSIYLNFFQQIIYKIILKIHLE